ncbi:hypothetical protein ML401_38640 [Bradyrhizobium sp. 62B]|nr:hypothetical protein ML401_38640 [Bradyrhizobium sp. 62B]
MSEQKAGRDFVYPSGRRLEDLQRGIRPVLELALDFLARGRDGRRRGSLAHHAEIVEAAAHQLLELVNHGARGACNEAPLQCQARLVQRGMCRTSVIDAHEGAVIEPHHRIAGAADGPNPVERDCAGKQDHDTKSTEYLVANRHHESPVPGRA